MRPGTASTVASHTANFLRTVILLLLLPATVQAEEKGSAGSAAKLYQEAEHASGTDDFAKAVELLEASVAQKPTARAYHLLGNIYLKLERVDDAKKAFQRYLKLEPDPNLRAQVRGLLKDLGDSSATRLKLTTEPPGATVYLDYKAEGARGKTPLELPVSAGRHRVYFELEGYEPAIIKNVIVKEGQEEVIHRDLVIKGCDVNVATNAANAKVRMDGKKEISLPATTRVSPGEHSLELFGPDLVAKTVTIQCEGYRPVPVNETLAVIEKPKVDLALQAALEREAQREAQIAKRQRSWLGVGIAAAAVALGAEGLALASRFQGNQTTFGTPEYNRFRTIELASQIGAGTLAALAAGSFAAFGILERRKEAPPAEAPTARQRLHSPRMGVLFLPGGAGLSYGARF
jgi:hypothetical protein